MNETKIDEVEIVGIQNREYKVRLKSFYEVLISSFRIGPISYVIYRKKLSKSSNRIKFFTQNSQNNTRGKVYVIQLQGTTLERVRRVHPHPLKFGNGCAAPILRTPRLSLRGQKSQLCTLFCFLFLISSS